MIEDFSTVAEDISRIINSTEKLFQEIGSCYGQDISDEKKSNLLNRLAASAMGLSVASVFVDPDQKDARINLCINVIVQIAIKLGVKREEFIAMAQSKVHCKH